jgi:(p)ppGpp synthase/HD superfamily hydrolase
MLCSAYLHDVVEDTGTPISVIEAMFGTKVKELVWAVSDGPGENRKARKLETYKKIRATPGATQLKLADRIANVENCLRTGETRLLTMYKKEQQALAHELRVIGELDAMWNHLEFMLANSKLDAFPKDVHTEHCCGEHKHCKYGQEDDACTVARGTKLASYRCNCAWM